MAERLVIVSDMWGAKKGLWITSYLGYLQQYFDITFYDCLQLAGMETLYDSDQEICRKFREGGIETAVRQLLKKEDKPSYYLTFCMGGTIAWKAALRGLPVKSLYAGSPGMLHLEKKKPNIPISLLYGGRDANAPSSAWAEQIGTKIEVIPNFGCQLYTDEKIIKKVCLDLLESVMTKLYVTKKAV